MLLITTDNAHDARRAEDVNESGNSQIASPSTELVLAFSRLLQPIIISNENPC